VFRNLKPENIVFTREDDFSSLKLCNFEYTISSNSGILPELEPEDEDSYYSKNYDRMELIQRRLRSSDQEKKKPAGTVIFMAPEMIQEQTYDEKVDIWSLGVIFYLLLTNTHPLQYLTDFVKKADIKDAVLDILQSSNPESLIDFDNDIFYEMNSEIEFLMKKMLKIDRKERISASQILELQSILYSNYSEY
jgi:serine/threonine protein kinase